MVKKLTIDGEFKKALAVLKKIEEAGFEAYYVGGSVRDRLLDLEVNDVDIATSAQPYEIKEIFRRTVDVGIEHGTVMVLTEDRAYEITTFRTESTYKDFRRPESVTFVRSLKEDLKRRDFTMNAIAMNLEGQLIDPYQGLEDIQQEIIQAVGDPHERFNEDALRMMRAVRFAAQLNFEIEAETLKSIKDNAALLKKIAVERIQIEFEKLLTGSWRHKGLESMLNTGLYQYCPDLSSEYEALQTLMENSEVFKNAESAWAMLIYQMDQFNLKNTFQERKFLREWKLSNKMINHVQKLYLGLKKRTKNEEIDSLEIFKLGLEDALKIEDLMLHLDKEPKHDQVASAYEKLAIKQRDELVISGYDLMQISKEKSGPWLGESLDRALEAVIYEKVPNDKESIISYLVMNNQIPKTIEK